MKNTISQKTGKGRNFDSLQKKRARFLSKALAMLFIFVLAGLPAVANGSFLDQAFETSVVKNTDAPGDNLPQDYGTARVVIDYNSGDNSSMTTVTLTRSDAGVNMPDLSLVGDAVWHIATDRTNFTADVTFRYLAGEVEGITEDSLAIYAADSLEGPFEMLPTEVNSIANTLTITNVTEFSCYIIKDQYDGACFIRSLFQ